MHRQPGRLVDHHEVLVFEQDSAFKLAHQACRRARFGGRPGRRRQRRDAHLVAPLQPVLRFAAFLVDPHLALAQGAVDARARHPGQVPDQEIIEALIDLGGGDFNQADRGLRRFICSQ